MTVNPEHALRVICDEDGHKLAAKIFDRYMEATPDGLSKKPAFFIALDKLLSEFGASAVESDGDGGDELVDDDYDEDEDMHEAPLEEASLIREAIAEIAFLRDEIK